MRSATLRAILHSEATLQLTVARAPRKGLSEHTKGQHSVDLGAGPSTPVL